MKYVKMTVIASLEEGGSADDSKEAVTETTAALLEAGAYGAMLPWTFEVSNAEESWS